jgi:cytochrome c
MRNATMTKALPLLATLFAAMATPATAASAAPPPAFAVCRSCHSTEPGRNGIGPTLRGIVGSRAGDVPGYAFSPALKKSGVVWTRATLDRWLQGPMKMVPGTKMVLPVADPARRKAIIDYLSTLK